MFPSIPNRKKFTEVEFEAIRVYVVTFYMYVWKNDNPCQLLRTCMQVILTASIEKVVMSPHNLLTPNEKTVS